VIFQASSIASTGELVIDVLFLTEIECPVNVLQQHLEQLPGLIRREVTGQCGGPCEANLGDRVGKSAGNEQYDHPRHREEGRPLLADSIHHPQDEG
jgi:hypothetical protein